MVLALRAVLLTALAFGAPSTQRAPPPVRDDAEDEQMSQQELEEFGMAMPPSFKGHLIERWKDADRRCCSVPAAPLVVDTHMHVWDEDPRPNRGLIQLGLLEDVLTESWGEGVDLGVLVQPGFRGSNNSYIERSLELFPGTLSGEVEAVKDYSDRVLGEYHDLGVRGLRFKVTSLEKYKELVLPRLQSRQFTRIARFLRENHWHWGVQLSKEVSAKWKEILSILQDTEVPIIVDMFGRPDPIIPAGAFPGTLEILEAAARPPPAGKIWMELGAPFRVDPRCTYAEPAAADPERCQVEDRVRVPRRGGGNESRILCCPPQTHQLLIDLAKLFIDNVGEDFVVWGTDWPFISDAGVTIGGLLDAVAAWVPDLPQRQRVLGVNAVRPSAVGDSPMYPLIKRVTYAEQRAAGQPASNVLDVVLRPPVPVADSLEDEAGKHVSSITWPHDVPGGLVERWKRKDARCCSPPLAPVVVDTHAHVWDEDPRPNRGFDQLGLLEDMLVEGWGVGVHLAVLVQPGFRLANNSYIARSLEKMPGRLAGEVEAIIDYGDATLRHYHDLGVRGLRFKATSLVKYAALVAPRLASAELPRIAKFMRDHDWHWGVQLSKEAGSKWRELLRALQDTQVPVIVDMFGRPDPAAVIDIGTQAIVEAARRSAPAGKIWVELGGPFRVDPRCTYAEVDAADPSRCLKEDRVNITRRGGGGSRLLCCPPSTHELFVRLSKLFVSVVGRDYLVWGTDWPFISDQGVTTRGLLDAVASWLSWDGQEDEKLLFQVLGGNALRPRAIGDSPLFPLLDLRKRPPLRLAGIFAARREADALAFQHAAEEANTLFDLPVVLDGIVHWQNDTNNSLEYFRTACKVVEAGSAAVVGPASSAQTMSMMNVFAPLGLPVLGTSASDPMLRRYPNFLRLVPGDNRQSMALAAVMRHFRWTRMATVYQMDSYGENGLEAFWDWSLRVNGDAFRLPIKLSASVADMQQVLENIIARQYSVVVANVCCDRMFMARLAKAAHSLELFGQGFFWIFTDGVTNFMETGELGQVMPAVGQRPGLWGVIVDASVDDEFQAKLSRRFPGQVPHNVSVFSATVYDAVFAVARSLVNLSESAMEALSRPESCLGNSSSSSHGGHPRRMLLSASSKTRGAASLEALELLRAQQFHGVSGEVMFDAEGSRQGQRFKVLNVQADGTAARAGSVEADSGSLAWGIGHVPLFLGPTLELPSDRPPEQLMGLGLFGIMVLVLAPLSLILGCSCECVWKKAAAGEAAAAAVASSSPEVAPKAVAPAVGAAEVALDAAPPRTSLLRRLAGEPEPVHGCPPPTLNKPILGDFIAGGVKAIIELVGCLTFSALMAPDELQPFLPVFLNYALFGFVVSQLFYNLVSRYTTPVRTCNISAAIFFLEILATCRKDLAGVPHQDDITVNTMLMAATITTWMSGALTWVVGTFKLTNFVRYLSEPVKLGMQVSLGYFLFATGFSISTGISWLEFTTLGEFGVYFEPAMLLKWTVTMACALSIFYALNRWSWPYTIPVFVGAGVGIFHIVLVSQGISIEEATDLGWLYPPPAGGSDGSSAFSFIGRIYDVDHISWRSLRFNLPAMGTAALVAPFLSAVINLILFETAFDPEEFGKSTLSYELRMDGLTQWLLAVIGGYSTSPSCGGTAVHRRIGARTNWGLFASTAVHATFLLVPGSTDVLQFVPKYVVGAVSLIVAISLLDTGLRGGYSKLSLHEYAVVCLTMLMSMFFGIESGIAGGWILSFALFIREAASTRPLRLDVDAGLVSSHAIWGMRSAQIVAQVRGAVRMISFQGVLFFAAVQPMLKEAERRHLLSDNTRALFVILDFSAVAGVDDSSPFEFKNFTVQAKKVGVSIVLSGCDAEVLNKLRKVGAVPRGSDVLELADDEDLMPAAGSASAGGGIDGCGFFVVGSTDRAMEFCEAALALRTLDLCQEVVPKPTRELEMLAALVEGELGGYQHRLARGETLERKEGEIFILTEGAIEAVVQLRDAASGRAARPEVVLVYRTLPRLPKDFCFSSSTPGVLRAVTDAALVLLPQGALSQLRHSERWADVEVVWGQLAEFMARAMHPMAMKATMQDVRGSFTSGAAEAFGQAVYEHRSVEGRNPVSDAMSVQDQKNFLRRLFLGGGARLRELRQSVSVGRRPVFASLQDDGSPADMPEMVAVDVAGSAEEEEEEKAMDTRDELIATETTPGAVDLKF